MLGNSADNTGRAVKNGKCQSRNIIINATKTKRDIRRIALDVMHATDQIKSRKPSKVLILKQDCYCLLTEDVLK